MIHENNIFHDCRKKNEQLESPAFGGGATSEGLFNNQKPGPDAPFISVCIPTYNRAGYIVAAIRSVIEQSFQNFEIIVADDGSTDETEKLVQKFEDKRIFYIRKEHSGAPETRNFALRHATGFFIAWLDSDDVLMPTALQTFALKALADPSVDVFYGNLVAADADLNFIRELPYVDWYGKNPELLSRMLFENPVPNCGSIIKRTAFASIGPYNISFRRAHDYEWWSRAAEHLTFRHINELVYIWRWHDSNMSSGTVMIDTSYEVQIIENLLVKYGMRKLFPQLPWSQHPKDCEAQANLMLSQKFAALNQMDRALFYARNAYALCGAKELRTLIHQFQKAIFTVKKTAPLHILFVAHNFANHNAAGTENHMLDLAVALAAINIHVEVFYPFLTPVTEPTLIHGVYNGIPFHELQYNGPVVFQEFISNTAVEKLFQDFLLTHHFDIVHFHHLLNLPINFISVAKKMQMPVAVTLHDSYLLCQRIHLLYTGQGNVICSGPDSASKCAGCVDISKLFFKQRFASVKANLKIADLITAPSSFMSKLFHTHNFAHGVQVVPLGLKPVSKEKGVPHEDIVFGYTGSIHTLKNVSFLVNVFKEHPKKKLVIFGNGSRKDISELETEIAPFNNITYMGEYQPWELGKVFSYFDVLVIPSLMESFSLTVREAFAARIPVIASNRGGIPEIVQNGINGLLFDPTDMKSLSLLLNRIVDEPQLLQSLAANIPPIKTIAENALEWEHMYLDLYGLHRNPKVSILIPVFNNFEYTRHCLETLYKYTSPELFEVLIVDNASTDNTSAFFAKITDTYSNIRYIRNQENVGFAKANNQAAALAKGKYLLCLNNDTEFFQPWLEPLIEVLEKDNEVVATGPKLLFPDRTIQHAGVVIINDSRIKPPLVARHIYYGAAENFPDTMSPKIYPVLTAACLLIRKEDFNQTGGYDERYWNGYEDVDLCFRLTASNKLLVFQPASVLIHHESKSGAERFTKVTENVLLLNNDWNGKVAVQYNVDLEGNIAPTSNTIKPYLLQNGILTSIVIPVFNNLEYTKQCIDSLEESTELQHEVVIVDNASTDGTAEYLKELSIRSRKYVIVTNQTNVGFPGAVNQGFKAASGDYLVVANNDLIFTNGWLDRLIELMKSNITYGITAPMSNFVSGVQIDKQASYPTIAAMHEYAASKMKREAGQYFEFPRVAFLCVLLRRELLDTIGGLDERFAPGNFEDDDFCLRAQMAGYKTAIAMDVFIHHYGSKSFLADGEQKYLARLEKNKSIFVKKWDFDPNEIWLQGKTPRKRNLNIPLNENRYRELTDRLQVHIADTDYEAAKSELELILKLIGNPAIEVSDKERDTFSKLYDKLCIITNETVAQ